MHPRHPLKIVSTAPLFLISPITAEYSRDQIVVYEYYVNRNFCPFHTSTTLSEDLTLTLDISTKNSTVDSIAAIGGGAADKEARRECYGSVKMHNTGPISEFHFGDWEVNGKAELSGGLTATVDMRFGWGFDSFMFGNTLQIPGPTADPHAFSFGEKINGTGSNPYCSGLDPDKKTYMATELSVHFITSIEKSDNVTAGARGRIGEKSDGALSLSTKLVVKEGCSKKSTSCAKDRTGFELCSNW